MKKIFLSLFFSIFLGAAFGQLSQFRMIGSGSWTTVNDSTFSSTVTIQSDLTANGFLPTGITDSMYIFTQTGQRYRISSAINLTFSSADLTIVESGGDWGVPVGQVMIYEDNERTAVPSIPFGATGATAKMQEAIDSYNSTYILSSNELADSTAAVRADFPSGGAGGGHVIADEGTALTQRDSLDFVGDGVTVTDQGTKTRVSIPGPQPMQGASGASNGSAGYVPQPLVANELQFLRGDGTWADPSTGTGGVSGSAIDESYPLIQFYKNSFTDSLDNWANFSSGAIALGTGANAGTMQLLGLGARWNGDPLVEGETYYAQIKIKDAGEGVRFYQEWSDLATTDTLFTGYNEVIWTQNIDAGGDQLPVLRALGTDTAFIDYIHFYLYNDEALLYTKSETNEAIESNTKDVLTYTDGLIWSHDFDRFDDPVGGILGLNWVSVSTLDRYMTGGNMTWNGNGTGSLEIGYQQFPNSTTSTNFYGDVILDVDATDDTLFIVTGNSFFGTDTIIDYDGIYTLPWWHQSGSPYAGIRLRTTPGDTVEFRSMSINYTQENMRVSTAPQFGLNSSGTGVIYGRNGEADGSDMAIGPYARAYGNSDGTANAIGRSALANAWRALAVGGYSVANQVSSTALGTGAYVDETHGAGVGRGIYIPNSSTFGFDIETGFGGAGVTNFGIGNWWGHKYTGPTVITLGTLTPSSIELKYHGQDAFDAQDTPDAFNVSGGDIGLYAGRGTGLGESGDINFYNGEGSSGGNDKDADILVASMQSDSSLTDGTHFWLRDEGDNTLKRANIQKDSTLYLSETPTTDYGGESASTDGSGDLTVSHDLGTASISVIATATGTTFYNVQVHTKNTTTFKIRFFDAAGAAVTSTAVTVDWIAKR